MNALLLVAFLCSAEDLQPDKPAAPNAQLSMEIIGPPNAFVGQLVKIHLEISGDARESEWFFSSPPGKSPPEYVLSSDKARGFLTVMEDGVYGIEVITVGKERGIIRKRLAIEFTYKNAEKVAVAKKATKAPVIDDQIKAAIQAVVSDDKVKEIGELVTSFRSARSLSEARNNFIKIAGQRAPKWNSFFAKIDQIFGQLKAEGLLVPAEGEAKDQKYVNTLQNISLILEGEQ